MDCSSTAPMSSPSSRKIWRSTTSRSTASSVVGLPIRRRILMNCRQRCIGIHWRMDSEGFVSTGGAAAIVITGSGLSLLLKDTGSRPFVNLQTSSFESLDWSEVVMRVRCLVSESAKSCIGGVRECALSDAFSGVRECALSKPSPSCLEPCFLGLRMDRTMPSFGTRLTPI